MQLQERENLNDAVSTTVVLLQLLTVSIISVLAQCCSKVQPQLQNTRSEEVVIEGCSPGSQDHLKQL